MRTMDSLQNTLGIFHFYGISSLRRNRLLMQEFYNFACKFFDSVFCLKVYGSSIPTNVDYFDWLADTGTKYSFCILGKSFSLYIKTKCYYYCAKRWNQNHNLFILFPSISEVVTKKPSSGLLLKIVKMYYFAYISQTIGFSKKKT